jgi:nitrite reductase/ring-hydroxylating ferredoxin subunit
MILAPFSRSIEMTETWTRACPLASLTDGEPHGVKLGEQNVALYKVDDKVFATDNVCSHAFALLSDGFLDGHVIECPLHGGMFNVQSGRCEAGGYNDIRTFQVDLRDGEVYVNLDAQGAQVVAEGGGIRSEDV